MQKYQVQLFGKLFCLPKFGIFQIFTNEDSCLGQSLYFEKHSCPVDVHVKHSMS